MKKNPRPNPSKRPIGQPTRGKTARHRLRRADAWLMLYDPGLLERRDEPGRRSWFVDLGFGAEPFTTLESAALLRQINPTLPVLGVEIDPQRIESALPYADELTRFRLGGFNLPLEAGESVRAIRAFNVLRQYDEEQVAAAHALLMGQVLPGGLLIEGTSDPYGRIWVANVLRRSGEGQAALFRNEGLLFSTNFHSGFEPAMFQPVLPKNFIHRVLPGEIIHTFIEAWKACTLETSAVRGLGLRQWFAASARALHARGFDVEARERFTRRGYLFWRVRSEPQPGTRSI